MSKQEWAAIVYGRSYHLDFRFITIPQDFTAQEIAWVSPYILATTQKARNLNNSPRWSLFKNDFHCVVGVTCMVRDLIGKLDEDSIAIMAKDDLGRPLYVFVGYVTKLNKSKSLDDFPAYTGVDLTSFKHLYQEIKKVWLLKDYDNRKPFSSEYKPFGNEVEIVNSPLDAELLSRLNNQKKHPEQTFVWQRSASKDNRLWSSTAQCIEQISICLNIKDKYLTNSPFLNQTVTNTEEFTIKNRTADNDNYRFASYRLEDKIDNTSSPQLSTNLSPSLKQKISTRAKEDIDLTIEQAAKLTSSTQEMISNLTPWSNSGEKIEEQSDCFRDNKDDFGFKNKKDPLPSRKQDWF